MGIPSYYKKLAKQFKGFYCSAPDSIKWLLMDYNCLIYQVLSAISGCEAKKFPGFSNMEVAKAWEKMLIEEICNYTNNVIEIARVDNAHVLIALDGVVPLAKMRQQRMRRFRSVALNGASLENWDTNAITPGTDFMKTLAIALKRRFPSALISDTSECGEGEHKIMEHLRGLKDTSESNVVIYGLDGDLFVLGLLANQLICPRMNFYFLREEQQSGKAKSPAEFAWLSLNVLKVGLISYKSESISNEEWLAEYAVAMSLLGNDFVPNGLGFRIKDGGHERLLTYLNQLHTDSRLVVDGELNSVAWAKLFDWLARDEEKAITASVRSKIQAAAKGSTEEIDKPLLWVKENEGQLWNYDSEKLRSDWQKQYARYGLLAPIGQEVQFLEDSVKQYIYAIEWTFTYYCKGADNISFDWMYNYPTAPLFSSVARQFRGFEGVMPSDEGKPTANEQLALVLPAESYWLIPRCPERQPLAKAQCLFPKKWEYYSFGKRLFWECEAHIPIPTIKQVRELI